MIYNIIHLLNDCEGNMHEDLVPHGKSYFPRAMPGHYDLIPGHNQQYYMGTNYSQTQL